MSRRLIIIVPTRGRPANVQRLIEESAKTADNLELWFAIDDNDTETYKHVDWSTPVSSSGGRLSVSWVVTPQWSMNKKLNHWARIAADKCDYIGFLGDDNVPITPHWDTLICEAIGNCPGVGYADDLIKGQDLCTSAIISASIVRCLGFMTPESLIHLYVDNFWMELGTRLGNLKYLPHVVVEHRHYTVGKSEIDEQYSRVNSAKMYHDDLTSFRNYVDNYMDQDIQKIRKYAEGAAN
jgi:hypothetical protein